MKYRTPGPWGSGEGANLQPADVDQNFFDLDSRMIGLEEYPPQAVSIESITVDANLMTIHLSNGQSEGPFALPVATLNFVGEYTPAAQMYANDLFVENQALYIVKQDHVAPPIFDPLMTSVEGPVYGLILPKPRQPYDIAFYYQPSIPGDGQLMLLHVASHDVTIPGLSNSKAFLLIATAVETLVFTIAINGQPVGSITFAPGVDLEPGGGQFGTFALLSSPPPASPDANLFLIAGDRLTIAAPDGVFDAAARGLAATIVGQIESV
jgi:hypothetical protein